MIDPNQHDRFVVTRRRRVTATPSLGSVDIYEFALADIDTPPVCHVRQRVSRPNDRIGFYADKARTVALMYLNTRSRFDPWARYELTDSDLHTVGEIQKAFVPRRRRSHYVLYGGDGDEVARVEAHVPVAVGRRRAAASPSPLPPGCSEFRSSARPAWPPSRRWQSRPPPGRSGTAWTRSRSHRSCASCTASRHSASYAGSRSPECPAPGHPPSRCRGGRPRASMRSRHERRPHEDRRPPPRPGRPGRA